MNSAGPATDAIDATTWPRVFPRSAHPAACCRYLICDCTASLKAPSAMSDDLVNKATSHGDFLAASVGCLGRGLHGAA